MDPVNRKTAIALGVIALCSGPLIWLLKDVKAPAAASASIESLPIQSGAASPATSAAASQPAAVPVQAKPMQLAVSDAPVVPSLIADVREPAKLRDALAQNAWVQEALTDPLGRGFVGAWAGFWGTKGEDIAASFKGEVADFVFDELLAAPVRLIWFENGDTGGPALLEPQPPAGALAAFDALTHAAGRGGEYANSCPGEAYPDGGAPAGPQVDIERWVIADHALYASKSGGHIALARSPNAVLAALCAKLAPPSPSDADVQFTLVTSGLGHEPQVLASLLGLGANPRVGFKLDGDHLVPEGISGALAHPERIAVAPLSRELLEAIPVDVPVLFTAQLRLPESLDAPSLHAFLTRGATKTLSRQVAVIWIPHGDDKAATEVAVLWSRTADQPQLDAAFSGPNPMLHATACGQLVYASTQGLLDEIQRTCAGRTPSMANAAGPLVRGLEQPASIGLQVSLGALLSGVTLDAWKAEAGTSTPPKPEPNELAAARKQLEALPTIGITGTAQGNALVAGGFHS